MRQRGNSSLKDGLMMVAIASIIVGMMFYGFLSVRKMEQDDQLWKTKMEAATKNVTASEVIPGVKWYDRYDTLSGMPKDALNGWTFKFLAYKDDWGTPLMGTLMAHGAHMLSEQYEQEKENYLAVEDTGQIPDIVVEEGKSGMFSITFHGYTRMLPKEKSGRLMDSLTFNLVRDMLLVKIGSTNGLGRSSVLTNDLPDK